jgi:amidohydrolase
MRIKQQQTPERLKVNNNSDKLKELVGREIGTLRDDLVNMAQTIYAKPEIGHQEYEASRILSDYLERHGFEVTRNIAGMETAFTAQRSENTEGPTIAILAEYDALAGMGHGCAHNLIGTAGVGAAVGLSRIMSGLKGSVSVFGCPAEEAGIDGAGGKAVLVNAGCFKEVDSALLFHPMPLTMVGGETSALIGLEFEFKGKAAHAAGNPWSGINALDGVLQTFNSINALRQHVRDDVRVHGIVSHGGDAPNIVPEYASARFFVRSQNNDYLKKTIERVQDCAKGAALATGAELKIKEFNHFYEAVNSNSILAETLENNLERVGLKIEGVKKGKGSTDFGNVSRAVPGCELGIRLGNGIVPHTREFLEASNSEEGYKVMMLGAEVMAMTAVDLMSDPGLLKKVRAEFDKS